MITTKSFAFALLLGAAVTGCAASAPDPSDDPSDPSNPGDPDQPLPPDVDASGKYQVRSQINLAENAPGKAGDVVRTIIAATDEADDPTKWILEQVIDNIGSGTIRNLLNGAKPFIAGYLNDRLLDIAPDFVTTMVTMGNDFGQAAQSFGLNETIELSKTGGGYTATRTVLGAHFKIDAAESDYAFADYGTQNVVTSGVSATLEPATGKLTFGDHKVGLPYGAMLRIGLDNAIIPLLDPSASNLLELLQHQVDCYAVGYYVDEAAYNAFGFSPGPGTFEAACDVGLQKAADLIYSKIADIDGSALELGVTGVAKALDKNGDKQLDTIQTGKWEGNMSYAGTPATLTDATFYGSRM
ncbi:MAG TPA: hypothetical protein VFQ53_26805 [Kofleriaceae bacterium]|nr:hypothetical protein [Kofleriaceae bacterium]